MKDVQAKNAEIPKTGAWGPITGATKALKKELYLTAGAITTADNWIALFPEQTCY